jgi:2-(1,2-epoxy-1,2-dihydrophenyl)acetyl-CoA isomerase
VTPQSPVALDITDGLAHLTLDRPDELNTINLALAQRLHEVALAVAADPTVRAVLIDGAGRSFCGGGDLRSFEQHEDIGAHLREITTHLHAALTLLHRMPAPTVVAVHGAAAGAGLGLACSGDVVLAAEDARFVFAYTAIGFTGDGGTTWWLPRLVGLRAATELALTNRVLRADEAVALGLVTRAVPAEELAQEALAMARTLCAGPTQAMAETITMLRRAGRHSFEEHLAIEAEALSRRAASAEGREGVAAFLGKRPPVFDPGAKP